MSKDAITLNDLKPESLFENNYTIKCDQKNKILKLKLAEFFYSKMIENSSNKKILMSVLELKQTYVYDAIKTNFSLNDAKQKKYETNINVPHRIEIIDSNNESVSVLMVSYAELKVGPKEITELNYSEALSLRGEIIQEKKEHRKRNLTESQRHEKSKDVAQYFASGRISILEACDRANVDFNDYLKWVATDPYSRRVHHEGSEIGAFVNETQLLTAAYLIIIDRFETGYEVITETYKEKKLDEEGKEFWVDKGVKETIKPIHINALLKIIELFGNKGLRDVDNEQISRFANMTMDQIRKHIQEKARLVTKLQKDKEDTMKSLTK